MEYEDEIPLHSQILETLWQGGTDDEMTTYRGNKRLPTLNDPKPFDVVVSLCAYTLPVGWLVKEMRDGWSAADAIGLIREKRSEYVLSNKQFHEYVENWVKPQSS